MRSTGAFHMENQFIGKEDLPVESSTICERKVSGRPTGYPASRGDRASLKMADLENENVKD